MRHMQMHFVPRPICIPIPVFNQHLYVRVVLLNIHTTFVIQHGPKYDMMHEDSLTTYRKYINNNKSSSQHSSFRHFTCYYKTSTSFDIIQHYTTWLLLHHSTFYNIVITVKFLLHHYRYNYHFYSPYINNIAPYYLIHSYLPSFILT